MSNNTILSITAPIHSLGEIAPAGKFEKRDLVLEIGDGKFVQTVPFEAFGDKMASLEGLSVGDEVTVRFGLRGREWKGRYFTNLSIISVENAGGAKAKPKAAPAGDLADSDDMPF